MVPFHFLDGASSGVTIIKYTHTWADCLTLEKCLCVWRWGEYILETFHFGRKMSYIPPSSKHLP